MGVLEIKPDYGSSSDSVGGDDPFLVGVQSGVHKQQAASSTIQAAGPLAGPCSRRGRLRKRRKVAPKNRGSQKYPASFVISLVTDSDTKWFCNWSW